MHFGTADSVLNVLDLSRQLTARSDLVVSSNSLHYQALPALFIVVDRAFLIFQVGASVQLSLALLLPKSLIVEVEVDLMKLLKVLGAWWVKLRCGAVRVLAVPKLERRCLSRTTLSRYLFFIVQLLNNLLLLHQLVW